MNLYLSKSANDLLKFAVYIFIAFGIKLWIAIKTYEKSWSGAQLHSDPTTIPGHGTDDYGDEFVLFYN